jgi:hypothetical protein
MECDGSASLWFSFTFNVEGSGVSNFNFAGSELKLFLTVNSVESPTSRSGCRAKLKFETPDPFAQTLP